ncbi:MAG: CNP1-like family protein [Burkholderiaceae bacterium]|jgi:hypothetical protein
MIERVPGALRTGGRALAGAALACSLVLAQVAKAAPLDDIFGDPNKDWTEIKPDTPSPVQDDKLIGFYVSPNTSFRFALDSSSITLGKDGVIHYVLVGTSSEGARNVSFQGMRCATREVKIYAFGRSDGTWTPARTSAWARVGESDSNRENAALYKEILCPDGFPLNLKQVVDRLRTNPYASIPK